MPEAIQVTKYKAFDGTLFDTEGDAERYEEGNFQRLLVGLSEEQVADALVRHPRALAIADAIEKAGGMIARSRREAGDLRRRPRVETTPNETETA